jgi:GTP cyclohydrolase I
VHVSKDPYVVQITGTLEEADVVVDDIVASGATRERCKKANPTAAFGALIEAYQKRDLTWYVFPWEGTVETSADDIPLRMLQFIGEDPLREGLKDTPSRVVKAWKEFFCGYAQDPKVILGRTFESASVQSGANEMVMLRDIEFYSHCEHHLVPFFGRVHIAYIPGERVVGISKLARLVECFARRLQIQERMTCEIADSVQEILEAKGCAVYVEAKHLCMVSRGVGKQNSVMVTSALRGALEEQSSRMEFLLLANRGSF